MYSRIHARSTTLRRFRAFSTVVDVPSANEQLAGTAAAHRCYILLHTPQPPSSYPAKYATPLQRKLLIATAPWGGTVNFAWSPSQPVHPLSMNEEDPQAYHLTAFSARGKMEIDTMSLTNVEEVASTLRAHAEPPPSDTSTCSSDDIHLYVCTHGARDCRCGDTGGAVVRAIRGELEKRRQHHAFDPSVRVKLAEVAHVGGHKYAANILVYPHGEWLGNVRPENVSEILDAILRRPTRPMNKDEIPICPSHWRGRMGLSKDEQIELFNSLSSNDR